MPAIMPWFNLTEDRGLFDLVVIGEQEGFGEDTERLSPSKRRNTLASVRGERSGTMQRY